MVLNDKQIHDLCLLGDEGMIFPFVREKVRSGALSYGLGHFGYDIRIADEIVVPKPLDPHEMICPALPGQIDKQRLQTFKLGRSPEWGGENILVLEPGDFVMAGTLEYFRIPGDIVGVVHDKSTLARLGIAVQNTVMEPGWEGYLTVEISNHGVNRVVLTKEMPIAQVIFFRGDRPQRVYTGRYQGQERGAPAKS